MFFLIRVVFWLTIVFTSMSWSVGASSPNSDDVRGAVLESGLAMAGAVKDAAVDRAKAWCVKSPAQCLADAARLTALVSAHQNDEEVDVAPTAPANADLPVPPAAPRRHARTS